MCRLRLHSIQCLRRLLIFWGKGVAVRVLANGFEEPFLFFEIFIHAYTMLMVIIGSRSLKIFLHLVPVSLLLTLFLLLVLISVQTFKKP